MVTGRDGLQSEILILLALSEWSHQKGNTRRSRKAWQTGMAIPRARADMGAGAA